MLLVVDSDKVSEWHRQNLERNADHYAAWASYFGPSAIQFVQNLPPSIYYNVNAPLRGFKIPPPSISAPSAASTPASASPVVLYKYGVIAVDHLIDDLQNWSYLYTAGRLQKPVYEIQSIADRMGSTQDPTYMRLKAALADNWRHALAAALLDLPERFSDQELYTSVVSLSYRGDVRMAVGENPHKISNIVKAPGNLDRFHSMYSAGIKTLSDGGYLRVKRLSDSGQPIEFSQDLQRHKALVQEHLPGSIKNLMDSYSGPTKGPAAALRVAEQIVRTYSFRQTVKGFISLGPITAIAYAARKLVKNLRGRLRL
jgi:mitochondrial translocator assembly and maintenance protein 41